VQQSEVQLEPSAASHIVGRLLLLLLGAGKWQQNQMTAKRTINNCAAATMLIKKAMQGTMRIASSHTLRGQEDAAQPTRVHTMLGGQLLQTRHNAAIPLVENVHVRLEHHNMGANLWETQQQLDNNFSDTR
jgi:hypothetical protein